MQQTSFSKSELARQAPPRDLIWKKNDFKAQKNGAHSNIYWVKVNIHQFRNNPSTKTAHKNLTNGQGPTNTLEIGKIIKNKDLEFSTTLMEINIKEDGLRIKDTDKVPIGLLMLKTN